MPNESFISLAVSTFTDKIIQLDIRHCLLNVIFYNSKSRRQQCLVLSASYLKRWALRLMLLKMHD